MKIAVLTMTFNNNYGGMLQAYALMEILKRFGHSPELLFVQMPKRSIAKIPFSLMKRSFLKHVLKRNDIEHIIPDWIYLKFNPRVEKYTNYFIEKYINPKTDPIYTERDFRKIVKYKYDAYIVGSDQVWRPKMYRFLHHAFFDFVDNNEAIRLSYAASFGVDSWEYSANDTVKYRKQIQNFKAVSVREDSGVDLCKEYLQCNAVQVLDPTFLLDADDYRKLYMLENEQPQKGELLCYILDPSEEKNSLVEYSANKLSMVPFYVNKKPLSNGLVEEENVYPAVTSWLRAFDDAKFVITDSYHGCIFSIIFNKPFVVFGNARRGMARFLSLVKVFGAEERLVLSFDKALCDPLLTPFDYSSINLQLKINVNNSLAFLKEQLFSM